MATFVLVHGTGHGGWCWQKVANLLRGNSFISAMIPHHSMAILANKVPKQELETAQQRGQYTQDMQKARRVRRF